MTDFSKISKLSAPELIEISSIIRNEIIQIVSKNGGHLGASLGVVELTLALHHVFDTEVDKIIFDIGHQSYAHKLLAGRSDIMQNLRKIDGASGFTKIKEGDHFGAGHSSTSISAALGFVAARDLNNEDHQVVAVIGDGAMSAGMAYEAINNAHNKKMLIILNDNDMSISKPVGGLSIYLSKILSSKPYLSIRNFAKDHLSKPLENFARKMEDHAKGMLTGGILFECLGLYYLGPVDGHNFDHLIPMLKQIKHINGPVLLHVITEKGKGCHFAENAHDKCHGVSKFDINTGAQIKSDDKTYTDVFSKAITELATDDDKIICITAAMKSGTGLSNFANTFKDRFFDVGIAEQHAVTFAAGLACNGFKPFVCIYSTFLQRAYDQIVHDVSIQNLPVKFIIDRAGLVGADGATHAGSFDLNYLMCLPDFVIMAPSSDSELESMVHFAANYNDGPIAIRFPRGAAFKYNSDSKIELGKANIIKEGKDVAILSLGTRLGECLKAYEDLKDNYSITVVDARFAKPFDKELVIDLAKNYKAFIIVEEGAHGGFGSHILSFLASKSLLHKGIKTIAFRDNYEDQDDVYNQNERAGVNASSIREAILEALSV